MQWYSVEVSSTTVCRGRPQHCALQASYCRGASTLYLATSHSASSSDLLQQQLPRPSSRRQRLRQFCAERNAVAGVAAATTATATATRCRVVSVVTAVISCTQSVLSCRAQSLSVHFTIPPVSSASLPLRTICYAPPLG